MGDVTGVIFEALFLFDAKRESAPVQWIAADADHLDRIGIAQEPEGGVDAERPAAAQMTHFLLIQILRCLSLFRRLSKTSRQHSPPRGRHRATPEDNHGISR